MAVKKRKVDVVKDITKEQALHLINSHTIAIWCFLFPIATKYGRLLHAKGLLDMDGLVRRAICYETHPQSAYPVPCFMAVIVAQHKNY